MQNSIDYQDYIENYKRHFNNLKYKEIVDVIEYLKGKSTEDEFEIIDDCAVNLVSDLLRMDWGRSIVVEYTKDQRKFIKSEYLSNYFKESIKEMLNDSITDELNILLNSTKHINDMTEEEIKLIVDSINEYYRVNNESSKSNISEHEKRPPTRCKRSLPI